MKPFNYLIAGLTLLSASVLTSCDDAQFEGLISGAAVILAGDGTSETRLVEVHDGDEVTLSVNGIVGKDLELKIVKISGVNHPPIVHYLVDGQEVGQSRDFASFFSCSYKVEHLAPGEHTLSVEIPKNFENITYVTDVTSTTFNVLPDDEEPPQ